MKRQKHSHGHELTDHRQVKADGQAMLIAAGFHLVRCEYRNADLVGIRRIGNRIHVLTVEFERTVRNVIRNIHRNLANGSDFNLEVCMTPSIQAAMQRLIQRKLSSDEQKKVRVIQKDELNVGLLRSLNGETGVDSGLVQVYSPSLFRGKSS
ncbi:MAG: hypothetical protein PHW60_03710 [Kiritimatiellae bacterium]|nr:hypothetical protein [Kiritimatiellia bacterium]